MSLFSCISNKVVITKAKAYTEIPGMESMSIKKVVTFVITLKKVAYISSGIKDKVSNETFSIQYLVNERNELQDKNDSLVPGVYFIVAKTNLKAYTFKKKPVFYIIINKKPYKIRPEIINNVLMK